MIQVEAKKRIPIKYIKEHSFMKGINWKVVEMGKLEVPEIELRQV